MCSHCGLITEDPFNFYVVPENKQKLDNSDFDDSHYDHMVALAYKQQSGGLGILPVEPRSWNMSSLRGNPNVHRGSFPVLQHCTKTGHSFYAGELTRVTGGRREYFCLICAKAGVGMKRSRHYWPKGRPSGYVEQAVLTAIDAESQKRARIGLNPPSVSDIQTYAGGWMGKFVLNGFSFGNVRRAIDVYVRRGCIFLMEDQLTHELRIFGGRER